MARISFNVSFFFFFFLIFESNELIQRRKQGVKSIIISFLDKFITEIHYSIASKKKNSLFNNWSLTLPRETMAI